MPLKPEIKYYLDGKEVKPEDIVGESGSFKIQINIENQDKHRVNTGGKSKDAYTPYMVATVVDLPMNKFKM